VAGYVPAADEGEPRRLQNGLLAAAVVRKPLPILDSPSMWPMVSHRPFSRTFTGISRRRGRLPSGCTTAEFAALAKRRGVEGPDGAWHGLRLLVLSIKAVPL